MCRRRGGRPGGKGGKRVKRGGERSGQEGWSSSEAWLGKTGLDGGLEQCLLLVDFAETGNLVGVISVCRPGLDDIYIYIYIYAARH